MTSSLVKRKAAAKAAMQTESVTAAAEVYRVALSDLLGAKEGEQFRDALDRRIDERARMMIAEHANARQERAWWKFWA